MQCTKRNYCIDLTLKKSQQHERPVGPPLSAQDEVLGIIGALCLNLYFDVVTWFDRIDRCNDFGNLSLNLRPRCRHEYDDRNLPALEILLIAEALVGGDENLESIRLGCRQQLSVRQCRPTEFVCGDYAMPSDMRSQWNRSCLIEK